MLRRLRVGWGLAAALTLLVGLPSAVGFEGTITAAVRRGTQTSTLLYSVGTNALRIECGETDRPYPSNLIDLATGQRILLFPHNRSFVRLPPPNSTAGSPAAGFAGRTAPPGALGRSFPPGLPEPAALPAPPAAAPAGVARDILPRMAPLPEAQLQATAQTTNLLGYACRRYQLRQDGLVMEIWATDQLLAFEPYRQNQSHRLGPLRLEQAWGERLRVKKLFPLLAILRDDQAPARAKAGSGTPVPERFRFEVKSVRAEKLSDPALFRPPADYRELRPLPL